MIGNSVWRQGGKSLNRILVDCPARRNELSANIGSDGNGDFRLRGNQFRQPLR
jgi:hypothetical protein